MIQPTDLAPVFRRAAEIIGKNGHHKGGYCNQLTAKSAGLSAWDAPVCTVGALRVAAGYDPDNELGQEPWDAVLFLAPRIYSNTTDADPVERIADWNDRPERTAGEVVAELLRAAEAIEAARHAAVVPVGVRTSDGSEWELRSVDAFGTPRYVLAGALGAAPEFVFAELSELVGRFGVVSASGGAA